MTTIATATVAALGTVAHASAPGPSAGPICDHLGHAFKTHGFRTATA